MSCRSTTGRESIRGFSTIFTSEWIGDLSRVLNRGLLPSAYYALAEQIAGGFGPDVLTLQRPDDQSAVEPSGGIALATTPPRVRIRQRAEADVYAAKARSVVIRHASNHRVVAMIEFVSPGNKSTRHSLRGFVEKATQFIRAGIHLVVVDLFPPGPRDPEGIHKAIWDELVDNDFTLPPDQHLTLASYIGGALPEAFVELTAVGHPLADMPLFLTPELYIPLPLETSYMTSWEAVPSFWRDVLTSAPGT